MATATSSPPGRLEALPAGSNAPTGGLFDHILSQVKADDVEDNLTGGAGPRRSKIASARTAPLSWCAARADSLIAGAIAGLASEVIMHPFETVSTRAKVRCSRALGAASGGAVGRWGVRWRCSAVGVTCAGRPQMHPSSAYGGALGAYRLIFAEGACVRVGCERTRLAGVPRP